MGASPWPGRILYVTADLGVGGAEAMLSRLLTARPSIADHVTVVSLRPEGAYAELLRAAGVTVVQLDFRRLSGIVSGLVRLAKLISDRRPDIVQGWMYHGDLAALLALALSGRRRRTRLVWSIRCSNMDLRYYGLRLRLAVKACSLLSRWPDAVTANSTAGLKFHLGLGYHPRRAEVISNGINVEEFRPDPLVRRAVRGELGIDDATVVIAHIARVDPMKNHSTFLAAMEHLPDMQALLIGAGTANLQTPRNVLRLGPRRDVARLLTAADFVVSSSRFGEGFSNALAEGMACGLPAIATDVGDASLIVGETGVIVPCEDAQAMATAIQTLAQESMAARAARSSRARDRIVENFALAIAVKRFAELYASLGVERSGVEPTQELPASRFILPTCMTRQQASRVMELLYEAHLLKSSAEHVIRRITTELPNLTDGDAATIAMVLDEMKNMNGALLCKLAEAGRQIEDMVQEAERVSGEASLTLRTALLVLVNRAAQGDKRAALLMHNFGNIALVAAMFSN